MPLLIVALILIAYWYWTLLAVAAIWLAWTAYASCRRAQLDLDSAAKRRAELVERADREHAQVQVGDERGIYGCAWPAVQTYRKKIGPDHDSWPLMHRRGLPSHWRSYRQQRDTLDLDSHATGA